MLSRPSSPSFVLRHVLRAHGGGHISLAFSPDGKLLAAAGSSHEEVTLWLVADGKLMGTFSPMEATGIRPQALCLAFSPDGQTLAVGYSDDSVRLFHVADGKKWRHLGKPVLLGGGVWSVAFSPDGKILAMGMRARKVLVWRLGDGIQVKKLPTQSPYVSCLAFSSDSRWLAAGGDNNIYLWQIANWQLAQRLHLHSAPFLTRLAFGENNRLLMASNGGQVQGWHLPKGTAAFAHPLTSRFLRDLVFSPDGQWVAVTDLQWRQWLRWVPPPLCGWLETLFHLNMSWSGGASVWRLSDGRKVAQLLRRSGGLPVSVAFSPDGRYLAVGYQLGSVAVWERRR